MARETSVLTKPQQESLCDVSHCGGFLPNRIVAFSAGQAGLGDRTNRIRQLMNLGGFLCARVIIPPPQKWLLQMHNNGNAVPSGLAWEDFYSLQYLGDNNIDINNASSSSTLIAGTRQSTKSAWKKELAQQGAYRPGLVVVTPADKELRGKSGSERLALVRQFALDDFDHVWSAFVQQQQHHVRQPLQGSAFFWDLSAIQSPYRAQSHMKHIFEELKEKSASLAHKQLFEVDKSAATAASNIQVAKSKLPRIPITHEDVEVGCEYARFESSSRMLQVARLVLDNVFGSKKRSGDSDHAEDKFGVLHLRRTDSTRGCDTSLERVKTYISCSFGGPHAQRVLHNESADRFVMFLATDDPLPQFREDALALLREQLGVRAVDLDKAIKTAIKQLVERNQLPQHWDGNNYIVYAVGVTLKRDFGIGLNLELRRSICPSCSSSQVEEAFRNGRDGKTRIPFHLPAK